MKYQKTNLVFKSIFIGLLLTIVLGLMPATPEEGMFPLSEIHKIDLKKAGLKISPKDLYNPNGVSLIDALVNIGGCTGSFVSSDGLIITNHHCAFGAIAAASTTEKNYLENGFYAKGLEEEIPAQGNFVKITESYEDVSEKVLKSVENITDPVERNRTIGKTMKEIADAANDPQNSITAEVSEMFAGKTYVLFRYLTLRDVRLVFAPPQSIGNFGGETDNWVWPRHTGDFSFMRAYVGPDGKSAPYSKDNVPFHPKKHLKVNPNGVKEGDFTFILGYPGRTYRHRPSQYLEYQKEFLLPFTSELYEYAINTTLEAAKNDPELKLKSASRVKGLANTEKNFKGKIQGLKRINIIEQKQNEEKELQKFIDSKPELKNKYGNVLNDIKENYDRMFKFAEAQLWLRNVNGFSTPLQMASFITGYATEKEKPDAERMNAYMDKNINSTLGRLNYLKANYHKEIEKKILSKMLNDAIAQKDGEKVTAVTNFVSSGKDLNDFVDNTVYGSKIMDDAYFKELTTKSLSELKALNDPLINFALELREQNEKISLTSEEVEGNLNKLFAQLIDAKMEWKKTNFIPDANSTLRLTYGYIKGYNPQDAVYYSPITTLNGVIEKSLSGEADFVIPAKLKELYDKKDFGRYADKKTKEMPVAILYNMDTTGGNSGSPIMDAYGNLIGVNFDRAFEATINDFAWNESYSRSIGVDIRYVLWVTEKIGGATHIIKELGL
ncbi:MAG: S46 family peptidase [Melioribacteraceae bacterium]|nr:S46 family peptidase [Melioribacteraceae bacterium]